MFKWLPLPKGQSVWKKFTEISHVHYLRRFVQNGTLLKTWEANLSQSGWILTNLKDLFRLMTTVILCTNLRGIWTKSVGVPSKNVFCKNLPPGGAMTGS